MRKVKIIKSTLKNNVIIFGFQLMLRLRKQYGDITYKIDLGEKQNKKISFIGNKIFKDKNLKI